jgi:6-phosphogluconolactonase
VASALIAIVDPAEFTVRAAGIIAASVRKAAARTATISLALSGGRTPQPVHAALVDQPDMPWARVRVYFADERAVPPDDPDSNYGMARQSLLSRVPMAPDAVFRMEAERPDRDAAARDYAALLPDALDVLLLGLGADGHTCSLFPHSAEVRERVRRVVPARGPDPPRDRLTITPPVIARARVVVMLVVGSAKAEAVAAALEGPDDIDRCPGQLARSGTWVIDAPASARLGKLPG